MAGYATSWREFYGLVPGRTPIANAATLLPLVSLTLGKIAQIEELYLEALNSAAFGAPSVIRSVDEGIEFAEKSDSERVRVFAQAGRDILGAKARVGFYFNAATSCIPTAPLARACVEDTVIKPFLFGERDVGNNADPSCKPDACSSTIPDVNAPFLLMLGIKAAAQQSGLRQKWSDLALSFVEAVSDIPKRIEGATEAASRAVKNSAKRVANRIAGATGRARRSASRSAALVGAGILLGVLIVNRQT